MRIPSKEERAADREAFRLMDEANEAKDAASRVEQRKIVAQALASSARARATLTGRPPAVELAHLLYDAVDALPDDAPDSVIAEASLVGMQACSLLMLDD